MPTTPATEAGGALRRDLERTFGGELIDPGHPGYEAARRVWNGLVDRRPVLIARCSGTADVVQAVRVAAHHGPAVSIRAGGHQVAGSAVCDGGLVIDLSAMRGVHVDPARRTARIAPGVTMGELDRETQLFGLAAPGGDVTGTGVAGLALGGGLGFLTRAFGLTCDRLRSVEIVTAEGRAVAAGPGEHPDLLWAARGGGRGLGVVTSLELELGAIGPAVAAVEVYYPGERAEAVLRAWRDAAGAAPDTVTPMAVLRGLPRLPEVPADRHGVPVVGVGAVYAGPAGESERALAPFRRLADPLADVSGVVRYAQAGGPPAGIRAFMKSHFLDALSDAAIRTLLDRQACRVGGGSELVIRSLGGAARHAPEGGSAFAHRAARFNVNVNATWRDAALDAAVLGWCRATWSALRPHANGGVYLNFSGLADEAEGLREAAYGASGSRLDGVRAAYDPGGLFALAARLP